MCLVMTGSAGSNMFSPKKPKLSPTLCVVGVHGGVELLLLLLVLLTWKLCSMCGPHCNDFQCESKFLPHFLSPSSVLDLPYTYCLPLFVMSHSLGPFNEPEAHYTHRCDKCNLAAPLPWSSLTRDWVDEGWPCDTWGMSRASRGISCC